MAKNWMMNEAAKIFAEGTDKSAMQDIGFRYPLTSRLLTMLNPAGVELVTDGIPEYTTVRKVEANLKDGVDRYNDNDDDTDNEAPAKEEKANKRGRKAKQVEPEDEEDEEEVKPKKVKKVKEEKPAKKAKKPVDDDDDDDFVFDDDDE